ncbi:glycogen-binding domain-containing protein [Gemmatirosa kalamazoonensis]|uniref:glycogen-binding domain-containing protein n=1 Tax=Gemmatirosa kalamazoonensis TaxID=861299 RepID=UPI0011DCA809|nr:glycogen-binding domain-containing protein [Gemmatirosa kalamazoonensis]
MSRRSRVGAWLGGAAAAVVTFPIESSPLAAQHAQVTGSLDVGAASVAYDEFLRSSVATLSPAFRVEAGRASFVARGAYSQFLETGNYSFEGTLAASVMSPAVWKARGELFATASNTRYSRLGDSAATNLLAVGRVHIAEADRGLWLGTGFGVVTQGFNLPDDLVQADVGGWWRSGEATLTAQALPTRVGSLKYADFIVGARWSPPRAEVTATAGYRQGAVSTGVSRWAEIGGTYWLMSHLALIGGAGVFPTELWRGLPGGRYASAAVRIATHAPRASDPARVAELTQPYELGRLRPSASAAQFTVLTEPNGTRTLRLRAPGATAVELIGDFTDWLPTPLVSSGNGTFTLNVFLSPGIHRVNVRLDGGPWVAPPGISKVRDAYGGEVGLLVVQ